MPLTNFYVWKVVFRMRESRYWLGMIGSFDGYSRTIALGVLFFTSYSRDWMYSEDVSRVLWRSFAFEAKYLKSWRGPVAC